MIEFFANPAAGNMIALAAFVFSVLSAIGACISLWRTRNSRQVVHQLNVLMLEKEKRESAEQQKAEMGSKFVSVGSKGYSLRIFNKGKSAAHNVRLDFPDGHDPVMQSDVEEKFPKAVIEPHESIDLMTASHMHSPKKIRVIIYWEDAEGNPQQKTTEPTR